MLGQSAILFSEQIFIHSVKNLALELSILEAIISEEVNSFNDNAFLRANQSERLKERFLLSTTTATPLGNLRRLV